MEIRTKVHTIFMMVGATESGKTTFAKNVLIPQLKFEDASKNFKSNVQYISSDEIRQEILGHNYHKHSQIMLESSQQAFHMLFEKIKAVTSFPIQAEFVIVDTIGLAEEFREEVQKIAKENGYHLEIVLFDYKNTKEYYSSDCSRKIIAHHVSRLKKEVMSKIHRAKYNQIHRIRARDFYNAESGKVNTAYTVVVEDAEEYMSHILPAEGRYIIVGDVHERVEELKELLAKYGFVFQDNKIVHTKKIENYKIVLVGDFIDKGKNTEGIIEFISHNLEWFYIVKGNHENFVYKYLKGELSASKMNNELIDKYFDSIKVLQHNDKQKEQFFHLVDISKEFYRFIGLSTPSFYITHAPCKNKYVGKLSNVALRKQRKFSVDKDKSLEEQLSFIKNEAVTNHPYHVFGHIATNDSTRVKNKIGIDTGCVYGNALTSVVLDTGRPLFKKQKSKGVAITEQLPSLFKTKEKVSLDNLDDNDKKRLYYVLKNKINFISGTMPPADKDEENHELESLKNGLLYFKNKGIDKVVLQPKYMGSRCTIYVNQNIEKCFSVSRNGYKATHEALTHVYERLLNQFGSYMQDNEIETLILDGELLPWSVLGKGLIERQFNVIDKAIESELHFLKEYGFEEQLQHLITAYQSSGFDEDQNKMSKKELSKKYGDAIYQNFKHVQEVMRSYMPLEEHIHAYDHYKEQLLLYGQEGEIEYKPFDILKIVKKDGEEEFPSFRTSDMFKFLSTDEYAVIDFTENNWLEMAGEFYKHTTTVKRMEGIVIKPDIIKDGITPYMKVRNPDYLTIIYGYDYRFPRKYSKLIKQKNIGKKVKAAISEYKLGKEMLTHKLDSINENNKEYQQLVANMLFETSKEKEIDPRL